MGFFCRDLKDFAVLVADMEKVATEKACERLIWFEEDRHATEGFQSIEESGDDFSMDDF